MPTPAATPKRNFKLMVVCVCAKEKLPCHAEVSGRDWVEFPVLQLHMAHVF